MSSQEVDFHGDAWHQQSGETKGDYGLFVEFCKLGPRRSVRALAAHLGYTAAKLSPVAQRHNWLDRADAFDVASQTLVPDAKSISAEDTLAFQYAVGKAMVELGLTSLQLKNPSSIKMGDIIKLLSQGAEMQRKAAGVNDTVNLNVQGEAIDNLNRLLNEIEISADEVSEVE